MTATTYQTLITDAQILEEDGHGPKVMRLTNGSFLKLFRRKRLISSEAIRPYAQRFADNALALHRLGIPAPEVIGVYRLSKPLRTAVIYNGVPGITLRRAMAEGDHSRRNALAESFGVLLAKLHEAGVYFRSLHLGNVVLLPDERLGLIDFADMYQQRNSLSNWKRQRNVKHMQRYKQDRHWLFEENLEFLRGGYEQAYSSTKRPTPF